jgi:hypothetical protein
MKAGSRSWERGVMVITFDPPMTPEELMTKLIGDYPREAWRIEIHKTIESNLTEVHPQGGMRYINETPRSRCSGTIHMQTGTGYIEHNPIATLNFEADKIHSVNVSMRDGARAEKLIHYLGKRLTVVDV